MVSGILFDMDGTLVESEPIWAEEELKLAAELGVPWTPETSEDWVGMPISQTAGEMVARGAKISAEEVMRRLSSAVGERVGADIPWIPGVFELLQQVAASDIPAAIVTNAARCNVDPVLDGAPEGALQFAVTLEDVHEGKPSPEPYLRGAEGLGIDPHLSIAFEDSIAGATAARDAGLEVWFVETHTSPPPWVTRSVKDLTEVSLQDLTDRLGALSGQNA